MDEYKPSLINRIALQAIVFYKVSLSPLTGNRCRFYPTCSEYASKCFAHYPFYEAFYLSLWRILRCQPFSKGYIDEPPYIREKQNTYATKSY